MYKLSDVTLLIADGRSEKENQRVLDWCCRRIDFGAVHNITSWGDVFPSADLPLSGWSSFVVNHLHEVFTTAFCLVVQRDGFIRNHHLWNDEFLLYDYVGAPWDSPWDRYVGCSVNRVGNGGFSLRSKKLMTMVSKHNGWYNGIEPEDAWICQRCYVDLCRCGIKFAPFDVARRFSIEAPVGLSDDQVFGFHRRNPPSDFIANTTK